VCGFGQDLHFSITGIRFLTQPGHTSPVKVVFFQSHLPLSRSGCQWNCFLLLLPVQRPCCGVRSPRSLPIATLSSDGLPPLHDRGNSKPGCRFAPTPRRCPQALGETRHSAWNLRQIPPQRDVHWVARGAQSKKPQQRWQSTNQATERGIPPNRRASALKGPCVAQSFSAHTVGMPEKHQHAG
jgi:hypothetical protein